MATARMETTHGLAYLAARALEETAWQSIDAVCLCCLTHGSCVEITGLQYRYYASDYSAMEATSSVHKRDG